MNLKKPRFAEVNKFWNVHVRFASSSRIGNVMQKSRAGLPNNVTTSQAHKRVVATARINTFNNVSPVLPTRMSTIPLHVARQALGKYLRDGKILLAYDLYVLRFRKPSHFMTLEFSDIYSLLLKLLALPREHQGQAKDFIKDLETSGVPRLKVSLQMYEKIILACVDWGDLRQAIEIWNKLAPSERSLPIWNAMLKLYLKTGLSLRNQIPDHKMDITMLDDESIGLERGKRKGVADAGLSQLLRAAALFKAMIAKLREGVHGNKETPEPDVNSILLGLRVLTALGDTVTINEVLVVSISNIASLQILKENSVHHDYGARDRRAENSHSSRSGAATIVIERVLSALVSLQKYNDVEAIVTKYIVPRLLAHRQKINQIYQEKHTFLSAVCSFKLPEIELNSHFLDRSRSSDTRTLRYLIQMCKKKQDAVLASFYWFLFVDPPLSYSSGLFGPDLGTCAAFLSLFGRPPIDGQILFHPMDLATAEDVFVYFCKQLEREGMKGVKYLQEGLLQARFAAGEYEGCENLYKEMYEKKELNGGISSRVLILMQKVREVTCKDVDTIGF
ncbi:hypothetical protein HK096_000323 [Nowakowskiella sp. JEL0078]|nr:hypothetical protein HK096_000323 [Nowakowskiella sp. JEL0078]